MGFTAENAENAEELRLLRVRVVGVEQFRVGQLNGPLDRRAELHEAFGGR